MTTSVVQLLTPCNRADAATTVAQQPQQAMMPHAARHSCAPCYIDLPVSLQPVDVASSCTIDAFPCACRMKWVGTGWGITVPTWSLVSLAAGHAVAGSQGGG